MSAGKLRHYAELQQKQTVSDGGGGETVTWAKQKDIWCEIRPVSGSQRMESMRRNSTISHEILAWYDADITTEKRIVFEGKAFNIDAVYSPDEKHEYSRIIASEGVAT